MKKKVISIISALVLSIVIWGSVNLSNYYYTTLTVPLKLLGMPHGYTSSAYTVKNIQIRIKGEGWKLASLMLNSDMTFIVPAGLDSGKRFINLNDAISENTWIAGGIQVLNISPDTLSFKVERVRQKKVKIVPDIELNFKSDYGIISDIILNPDSVIIYGARSVLKNIDSIKTIRKSFYDLESPLSEQIDLENIDGISYLRNSTNISLEVQRIVDKIFDNIPIHVQNIPHNQDLVLFPNQIDITLRGGINVLGKMGSETFHPYIDFQQAYEDTTGLLIPELNVPPHVSIIDIRPSAIKYIIKKY
jgi:YbbR domain-containing protein